MKIKNDWITFIAFLLIIAAMFLIAYYNYVNNVNECTSDPLKYGVEKIRDNYDADFVSGRMQYTIDGLSTSWDFGDEYELFPIG